MNKTNWPQNMVIRFWNKVNNPGNGQDCWKWTACVDKDGYGKYTNKKITNIRQAHRLSWEFYNGPIPQKLLVCHKCDNPSCVNPDHLYLGTNKDNMLDMKSKGRAAKGSNQGTSIFTEKIIEEIIKDAYNYKYMSLSEISRKYSSSVTIILNIFNGYFWPHVTEPLLKQLNITKESYEISWW